VVAQLTPLLWDVGLVIPLVPDTWGIGLEYANAIAFLSMVVVLLVRPNGIAGEAT
jgi:branched-chain amino acid transport system permease protein